MVEAGLAVDRLLQWEFGEPSSLAKRQASGLRSPTVNGSVPYQRKLAGKRGVIADSDLSAALNTGAIRRGAPSTRQSA